MDPIEKCFETLRVLVAQPSQGGLQLAERAIDELLSLARTDQGKTGMLIKIQNDLPNAIKQATMEQADFLGLVLDFTDSRLREIQERNAPETL